MLSDQKKFLLFSQGRCGSTTLQQVLNVFLKVKNDKTNRVLFEDLNRSCAEKLDKKLKKKHFSVSDSESENYHSVRPPVEEYKQNVRDRIEELKCEGNGLKHLITSFSYYGESRNYQDDLWFELDKTVFKSFPKVILNDRKNWLQWGVSFYLAKELNYYGLGDDKTIEEYLDEVSDSELSSIDIQYFRFILKKHREEWFKRVKFLEDEEIPYYTITYENFFGGSMNQKARILKNLTDFLEIEFNWEGHIENLIGENRKLSGWNRNYELIRNIEEVNKNLGPEFGFLY